MLITDSKGFYDSANSELPVEDASSALEMPIVREHLRASRGRIRWAPHTKNPGDSLTKFRGAHQQPLWALMRQAVFVLAPEAEELAQRAAVKQASGLAQAPRHKVGAWRGDCHSEPKGGHFASSSPEVLKHERRESAGHEVPDI